MAVSHELNTDLSALVVVHTASQEWAPSPSPSVFRKRVALEGSKEAGRVTSIVRYEPDSSFHEHGHPDGEEILVLSGGWSDKNGDHPAGTFMLNPEGFRHAPCSKDGCVLFVKLRQHGGDGRFHKRLDTTSMPWVPSRDEEGVDTKLLYADDAGVHSETIRLEKVHAGAKVARTYPVIAEWLLLSGFASMDAGAHGTHDLLEGTWVRVPAGMPVTLSSAEGVELYVKEGEWRP